MNPDYIRFKKQRELGEILSVLFKFLRENYKLLFNVFIKFVSPAFVLLIAAVSYYTYSTIGNPVFATGALTGGEFVLSFILMLIAVLLYSAALYGTIFHVIKSYISNNGDVHVSEVGQGLKEDFGKLLGLTLIGWVLIVAGTILFIIPGIYLFVPLTISTAILVFRRTNIMDSISESFQLVKDNWWMTFFSLFVIGMLIYLISFIFQIPLLIYTIIKTFTVMQEGSAADISGMFDWVYITLSIIASLIQYMLYAIMPLGISLVYFHLNEKQNFTGTFESIENLGRQ
ncbi:hypothetical protein RM549_04595 [Salegentibacter sp. F188]|uniref:Glycerophosphoryl diester phosphodiesterase membrane domain-containing protein n=1 Tax=Autumnicola patrickiae TaxID=3075591 RepID=A0ABU3DZA6_9FLAO|nr:hypothetical protein [Salegentibacter sp. F188]MDT0689051.1 hypothetical protein [Salegentibacter sp. F188]